MTNKEAYEGIVADTYDTWFAGDTFDDLDFYMKLMNEVPGRGLEIGCGTGRLLLPYLEKGFDVEGVEPSTEMVDICQEKGKKRGISPVIYKQYMQHLSLPHKYATIFIPLASFMLVTDREEAIQALDKMYAHLEDDGQIIIPLFIPREHLSDPSKEWTVRRVGDRRDGTMVVLNQASDISFNEQIQINWNRYELYRDSVLLESRFTTSQLRWYYKYEFVMMLEQIGYRDISIYGDYNSNPLADNGSFMVFRARK
jgi:SAM-dependent methyltransferase